MFSGFAFKPSTIGGLEASEKDLWAAIQLRAWRWLWRWLGEVEKQLLGAF